MSNKQTIKNGAVIIGTTSGSLVLDVQGTQGQLFSVTDNLTGDIFVVSDITGMPLLTVNSTAVITSDANLTPGENNTFNLGSASKAWANIYTNDLHLSNMNKPEGNEIDGTKGTWTIQEGEENLYIINNITGKKYKINLTEI